MNADDERLLEELRALRYEVQELRNARLHCPACGELITWVDALDDALHAMRGES